MDVEEAKQKLRAWMGRVVEVELNDGRVVRGRLACTDNEPNFVLTGNMMAWLDESEHVRTVPLAMVSRKFCKKISLVLPGSGRQSPDPGASTGNRQRTGEAVERGDE